MFRSLSLLGLGALALATLAVAVATRKNAEPQRFADRTEPPAARGVGLRLVTAGDYHVQFSVN